MGASIVTKAALFFVLGCALLRATPRPPDEWTFIAFPGSSESALERVAGLAPASSIAAACAGPNPVTFVVERICNDISAATADFSRQRLIAGNFGRGGYTPDVLRALMSDAEARSRFAAQAARLAGAVGFGGLLLDFRGLGPRDLNYLLSLVQTIADSAKAARVESVGIVIPVADTAAYPGRHLGAITDFLALRMELDPALPGPLSPRDRMAAYLGARAGEIGANRLMLLIPSDGYVWRAGEARVRVSFEEAVATARDWNVALVRDETSGTLRAQSPLRGQVWVNDAGLIAAIVRDARRLGINRFALYGLGGEDPALWQAIGIAPPVTR